MGINQSSTIPLIDLQQGTGSIGGPQASPLPHLVIGKIDCCAFANAPVAKWNYSCRCN